MAELQKKQGDRRRKRARASERCRVSFRGRSGRETAAVTGRRESEGDKWLMDETERGALGFSQTDRRCVRE